MLPNQTNGFSARYPGFPTKKEPNPSSGSSGQKMRVTFSWDFSRFHWGRCIRSRCLTGTSQRVAPSTVHASLNRYFHYSADRKHRCLWAILEGPFGRDSGCTYCRRPSPEFQFGPARKTWQRDLWASVRIRETRDILEDNRHASQPPG